MSPPSPGEEDAPLVTEMNNIQIIDEESSLSTATSLTSLITSHTPHTLRTGAETAAPETIDENPAPSLRMRSMSVPNSVFLSPEGTLIMRSGSAVRNRSNPRTRTPMRHASPLLVTGRLFETTGAEEEGSNGEGVGRRESILEETGIEPNESPNGPIIRPGRLLHAHARPSIQNTSATPFQSRNHRQPSNKQLPSHRKIRRWNNDRFIGTHSGTNSAVQPVLVTEGEEWYQEYLMPNYPREYRSEFAKLVNDDSKKGVIVRERFLKGEVGISEEQAVHYRAQRQFQGMSSADIGNQLYRKLSPRIRSILSRVCERNDVLETDVIDGTRTIMAVQAVNAFEKYIVSCILQSKKSVVPSAGFPPLLADEDYQMFEKIFCAAPDLVMKTSKRKTSHGCYVIPSIHFYFADDSNEDEKRKGAFYRILLYAVCNFHGLVASSCALDGKTKEYSLRKNLGKGVKVVTVQSGVVLGLDLKLLDFVGSDT